MAETTTSARCSRRLASASAPVANISTVDVSVASKHRLMIFACVRDGSTTTTEIGFRRRCLGLNDQSW